MISQLEQNLSHEIHVPTDAWRQQPQTHNKIWKAIKIHLYKIKSSNNLRYLISIKLRLPFKKHSCQDWLWSGKLTEILTSLRSSSIRWFLVAYKVGCAHGDGSNQCLFRSKPIKEHLQNNVNIFLKNYFILHLNKHDKIKS